MLKIFGQNYYLDIDEISEKCSIQSKTVLDEESDDDERPVIEINVFKYEIIKMCVDRVLAEFEDGEQDNLFKDKNVSTSFGLAFNTLINYEIIKEKDDE